MSDRSDLDSIKPPPHRPLSDDALKALFRRLAGIFGPGMSSAIDGSNPINSKIEWGEALGKFSQLEIDRGLDRCRTQKFPPNLPEFLHLCRPSLDPEIAWMEAEKGLQKTLLGESFEWSHPAVFWAAREMAVDIRTGTFATARKRWQHVLREQFAANEWLPIPGAAKALPQPTKEHETVCTVQAGVARAQLRAVVEQMRLKRLQREQP